MPSRHDVVKIFTLDDERHFRVVTPLDHGPAFQLLPADHPAT